MAKDQEELSNILLEEDNLTIDQERDEVLELYKKNFPHSRFLNKADSIFPAEKLLSLLSDITTYFLDQKYETCIDKVKNIYNEIEDQKYTITYEYIVESIQYIIMACLQYFNIGKWVIGGVIAIDQVFNKFYSPLNHLQHAINTDSNSPSILKLLISEFEENDDYDTAIKYIDLKGENFYSPKVLSFELFARGAYGEQYILKHIKYGYRISHRYMDQEITNPSPEKSELKLLMQKALYSDLLFGYIKNFEAYIQHSSDHSVRKNMKLPMPMTESSIANMIKTLHITINDEYDDVLKSRLVNNLISSFKYRSDDLEKMYEQSNILLNKKAQMLAKIITDFEYRLKYVLESAINANLYVESVQATKKIKLNHEIEMNPTDDSRRIEIPREVPTLKILAGATVVLCQEEDLSSGENLIYDLEEFLNAITEITEGSQYDNIQEMAEYGVFNNVLYNLNLTGIINKVFCMSNLGEDGLNISESADAT